jgi:hypothetical protein
MKTPDPSFQATPCGIRRHKLQLPMLALSRQSTAADMVQPGCYAAFAKDRIRHNREAQPRILLKSNPAGQHFPPHTSVAEKAEPGIHESGGLVVLKEEMPGPGKGVALHKGHRNQPPQRNHESSNEQHQGYGCANEVQPAGNPVGMLVKVERIKLFKRTVNLCFTHGDTLNLTLAYNRSAKSANRC